MTTVTLDDVIEILAPKRKFNQEHFLALLNRAYRRYDPLSRRMTFKQWDDVALGRYDESGKQYWNVHWEIVMTRCRRRYDHHEV